MARKVLGVDFGTTYSSVAVMDIGSPHLPTLHQYHGARQHVPTVLLVDPNDHSVISWGYEAENLFRSSSSGVVKRYFKRDLGTFDANLPCKQYLEKLAAEIKRRSNVSNLSEKDYITAIGAPANWSSQQKEMLKKIAEEVGFPDVRVISEPVAAMHNLRCQPGRRFRFGDRPEKYMVIDFGGGTLDICLVQTDELGRNPRILATEGDPRLGGVDFDDLLERIFLRQFHLDRSQLSHPDQVDLRNQIKDFKEAASDAFSRNNTSSTGKIALPDGEYPFNLARIVFDNQCRDEGVFSKIELAVERALETAGLNPVDVKHIVLTGGTSHWWFVKEIVSKKFGIAGEALYYTETPFTDVASGLAICIGRADEPQEAPGSWVRVAIDGSSNGDWKVILEPGRVSIDRIEERVFLGALSASKVLRSRRITIEWSRGIDAESGAKMKSNITIYCRSNHPRLERLSKMIDAARGKPTSPGVDDYKLFLLYLENDFGDVVYGLEVQDNHGRRRKLSVVPGQDVRDSWLGFGKVRREDPDEVPMESAANESSAS